MGHVGHCCWHAVGINECNDLSCSGINARIARSTDVAIIIANQFNLPRKWVILQARQTNAISNHHNFEIGMVDLPRNRQRYMQRIRAAMADNHNTD